MEKTIKIPESVINFINSRNDSGDRFNIKCGLLYDKYINYCIENKLISLSKIKFNRGLSLMGYSFYLDRNKCKVYVDLGREFDVSRKAVSTINKLRSSGLGYDVIARALNITITAIYNRMMGVVEFSEDEINRLIELKIIDDSLIS